MTLYSKGVILFQSSLQHIVIRENRACCLHYLVRGVVLLLLELGDGEGGP